MQNLFFEKHDLVKLANQYKTPLFVFSEERLRQNIQAIKKGFEASGIDYEINFAAKSFITQAMCKIAESEGICLDVASGGELYTALTAGVNPAIISLHGNNKSVSELTMAIENHIGFIMVDSENELDRLNHLTQAFGQEVSVIFRIAPGVEAHTHELIQTGKQDTKFGLPLKTAKAVIAKTKTMPYIKVEGIHCHIGSQIVDEDPFIKAAEKMLRLYKELLEDGFNLTRLNLGGGFGIAYLPEDESFDVSHYIPKMVDGLKALANTLDMALPTIMVEPGRYISATAGITLYTVGTIKEIPGIRTYISVDGGMADNPRPALYDAEYNAKICNRPLTKENGKTVRVSGKACETDQLIDHVVLADPQIGDILMVEHTGAYGYTMASNYNRLPRPAVVLLNGTKDEVIVERETYADLIKNDRIPTWLKERDV